MIPMLCAYCAARLDWPKDFPLPWYARCQDCYARGAQPWKAWKYHFRRRLKAMVLPCAGEERKP